MPDQHVTQMDGYVAVAPDAPQSIWTMTVSDPTPTAQSTPVAAVSEQE